MSQIREIRRRRTGRPWKPFLSTLGIKGFDSLQQP